MTASGVIYMFAMSLDGFIARPDGSFDWLENYPANDEFEFDKFMSSITGIVMGRGSYDVARAAGEWAYGGLPCTVATRRPVEDLPDNVVALNAGPQALLDNLRSRGANGAIWLFGGGDLASRFIDAGLLDTVEIGIIPVVLGTGIPAFGVPKRDLWLDMEFSRALANGAVHARYRVVGAQQDTSRNSPLEDT